MKTLFDGIIKKRKPRVKCTGSGRVVKISDGYYHCPVCKVTWGRHQPPNGKIKIKTHYHKTRWGR